MTLELSDVDLDKRLRDKDEYEKRLEKAQLRMLLLQRHLHGARREAVLVFEGWDAAGKGGAIRRVVERLDPRGFVVHPIGAPQPHEKGRHYLQRFWDRIPDPGCIGIFDRSWYGRVLVERVEKFCAKDEWKRAYGEINAFEKMLIDDGVPVVKFFLHISKAEQLKRFRKRERDPFRSWKIGPDDWRNRKARAKYEKAIDEMFEKTSTRHAPWHVIPANHKWFARVAVAERAVRSLTDFFKPDL